MPGVVGCITQAGREWAEDQVQRMTASLCREVFYTSGTWGDEKLGVYLGWTVARESFAESMPLQNERGDVVLVFSGEEYSKPETDLWLRRRGHSIEGSGASYLVHWYEEDDRFPAGLNGRFHGVLVDRNRQKILVFNDRYGMHRLYVHKDRHAFYFGVEAKAILAVCPELRAFDLRSLGEFVACGCVLENRSLFKSIALLPPASAWVFGTNGLETENFYFDRRQWEDQGVLGGEQYYENLREAFVRRLPQYLNGRERVAMSLSGGLDTRAIMAWQKHQPGSLPCYTYGGPFRESRDVAIARRIANICQQPHEVITVGEEFLSRFPHYAERTVYLTDGSVDLVRSPDLYVSEKARRVAPVRLTGLYGDEVLRNIPAFKPVEPLPDLFRPELSSYVCQAEETYHRLLQDHPLSFAVFRQAPWHHHGTLALEQTQVTVRTPFLDNEFVKTVFRAPKSASANNHLRFRLIADGNPNLQRVQTDRGLNGGRYSLRSVLTHAIQQFTFKAEYAFDYGMPQWLAINDYLLYSLHLERLFLGRHKLYHFRVWYRDQLAGYVREMLLDPRTLTRPYLRAGIVERIVQGHLKGYQNFTSEIHKLMTIELIHRLFVDS